MSTFVVFVLVFLIASMEAKVFRCPFRHANHSRRNCERSDDFRKFVEAHPEEKNRRSDIDPHTEDLYEQEQLKYCCYEEQCLIECGYNLTQLYNNDYAKYIPENPAKLIEADEYKQFFNYIEPTEHHMLATADSRIVGFWKIRATHFDKEKLKYCCFGKCF